MRNKGPYFIVGIVMMNIILLCFGCKEERKPTESGPAPLYIGKSYNGGTIAYILQAGEDGYEENVTHGLIAATEDFDSMMQWGCEGLFIHNAQDTLYGRGSRNTLNIFNECMVTGNAATACYAMDYLIYDDWYLPSKQELKLLYLNRIKIGGFNLSGAYWSSSQYDNRLAWSQSFSTGTKADTLLKSKAINIRAIRSF